MKLKKRVIKGLPVNRIYNMDCVEGLKQLPDNSIDLIVTSPLII